MKQGFFNARIVGSGSNPRLYHAQKSMRGDPAYRMSPSALKKFAPCPEEWVEEGKEIARLEALLEACEERGERELLRKDIDFLENGTDAQKFGNLSDTLTLTPELFDALYVLRPETYVSKVLQCPSCGSATDSATCRKCKCDRVLVEVENKWSPRAEECRIWTDKQEQEGKTIVTARELERATYAAKRMLAKPEIAKAISVSDKQVHVIGEWHDKCGVVIPVQCLIDLVPKIDADSVPGAEYVWSKALGDMKTSNDATHDGFTNKVHRFGMHIQAAFDLALYRAATGEDRTDWFLICQKNYGVFQPFKRIIPQEFIDLGTAAYTRMINNYALCLKTNRWPDYDAVDTAIYGFAPCTPSPWMAMDEQFAPRMEHDDEPEEDAAPLNEQGVIP